MVKKAAPEPMEPIPDSGKPMQAEPTNNEPAEGPDYSTESVEELEARFAAGEGVVKEGEPDPVPEPGPVAAAPTEADPEPQVASEDAPPEDAPAEPTEPETDDRELQMQEMQLQIERMRLDKQHFEHLAGKNATAVDNLRKELQTSSAPRPVAEDPIDYEDIPSSVAPQPRIVPAPDDGLAGKVAELQQSQMAQETERVYNSFVDKIKSDLSTQGVKSDDIETQTQSVIEQITPTLKQGFEPYGDLSTYSVKTLSKVTRMVLDSAYTDAKLAKVAELRRTNADRKATQISETRIAKQAASPSGSGSRGVQEPPPRTVNPNTGVIDGMTAEEADAELIRLEGDGGRLRP